MRRRLALSLWLAVFAPAWGAGAWAQPAATPPDVSASAPSAGAGDLVRIRGRVESVSSGAVRLELSRGLWLRIDLSPDAPMFFVHRLDMKQIAPGARLRLRVKIAGQGAVAAVEVMAMEDAKSAREPASESALQAEGEVLPELTLQGRFKAQEQEGEERTLVLADRGADRRVALTSQTTYWRLRPARLEDLKPGMSLSAVMRKNAEGRVVTQRAVFGDADSSADLPL
jgi:hypothetical protein